MLTEWFILMHHSTVNPDAQIFFFPQEIVCTAGRRKGEDFEL